MPPATNKITEVISLISGFGFPRENFIPEVYYTGSLKICKPFLVAQNLSLIKILYRHPDRIKSQWHFGQVSPYSIPVESFPAHQSNR